MNMAYKCEKASDEDKASDINLSPCDPCYQDGININAHGFCVDCGHNLCGDCFKIHLKPLPMRHHRLINKQSMSPTSLMDKCMDKCGTHRDEIVKYYCRDHKHVGCAVCITLEHRACDVGYIPTLAENLFETEEYKTLIDALESLESRVRKRQDVTKENIEDCKLYVARNYEEIRKIRTEINDFFDKWEKEIGSLEEIVKHFESVSTTKMQKLLKAQGKLADKIEVLQKEIDEWKKNGQFCRIFLDLTHFQKTIDEYEKDLDVLEVTNKVIHSSFQRRSKLIDDLQEVQIRCGSFVVYVGSIPLADKSIKCDVTDLVVLLDVMLAAADCDRKVLKIVDRNEMRVITEKQLPHLVKRISKVGENEVAVWFANTIEMFSVSDSISKSVRKIRDARLKWPMVYSNSSFIGFTISHPFKLCMLKRNDNVVKSLPGLENGESLFEDPLYIATNKDSTLIYVSDLKKNVVNCLTLNGEVKSQFRLTCDWGPRGLAVSPDGTVYMCDTQNHNIYILTPYLKKIGTINGEKFGMRFPMDLAYCSTENKLFVGLLYNDHIAVLNL